MTKTFPNYFAIKKTVFIESKVDKDKNVGTSDEDSEDSIDDDQNGGWGDYGAQDVNDVVNSAAMQMQNTPDLECDIKADRVMPKPLPQVTQGKKKHSTKIHL